MPSNSCCKPSSRGDFAARIIAAVARTIEAIFAVGDELLAAKAALPHGEFLVMTRRDLPFGERQAQRYMAIARHGGLRNATLKSLLPPSVTLLYQLSRIEPDELMPRLRQLQKYKDKDLETQVLILLQDLDIRKALDAPPVTCQGVQAEVNKIAERANADVQATHPTDPEPPADALLLAPAPAEAELVAPADVAVDVVADAELDVLVPADASKENFGNFGNSLFVLGHKQPGSRNGINRH